MWTGILVAALCGQLQTVKNLQCIVIQQMEKIGMHPFMAAGNQKPSFAQPSAHHDRRPEKGTP